MIVMNDMQEISEKAPQLPKDIKWHFIGHLQSNKAKAVIGEPKRAVPPLAHRQCAAACCSTVDLLLADFCHHMLQMLFQTWLLLKQWTA